MRIAETTGLNFFYNVRQMLKTENTLKLPSFSRFMMLVLFATVYIGRAEGIDCFKCVSVNGDNPACEDPFHNNFSSSVYESPCMGGRKGRNGLFPATACIKLSGTYCKYCARKLRLIYIHNNFFRVFICFLILAE
jgi:hypothetical protein